MPPARPTRASTSTAHDLSTSISGSRKRTREGKKNVAPSSRTFNVLSRYDDHDDDQVASGSGSDQGDQDSFDARPRRGVKPVAKQVKTAASSKSKSQSAAATKSSSAGRKVSTKSKRVEEVEDEEDYDQDAASIADTADDVASEAEDQDNTLRAVRSGSKSSGRSRAPPTSRTATACKSRGRGAATALVSAEDEGYDDETMEAPATTADNFLLERKEFDEWMEKKLGKMALKRERALEEKLQRMTEERDEIQNQFDELRQLRHTKAEETLEEMKRAAETRQKHDKELINSLKARAEAAERRTREAESSGGGSGSADRSMNIVGMRAPSVASTSNNVQMDEIEKRHRKEMAEAVKVQRKLEEDVNKYKAKLEEEIATSKVLLEKAHLGSSTSSTQGGAGTTNLKGRAVSSSAKQTELALTVRQQDDEKAVRKLYEDITGLVITGVEPLEDNEKRRRFKALFANDAYHSLVFELEESESLVDPPSGSRSSKKVKRDELVYQPQLDEDRDRAFLDAEGVNEVWYNVMRFDRLMAFPFFNKLQNALRL